MTSIPIICHTDGRRFTIAASALTPDLRCACGSADIDLDEGLEATASKTPPPWVGRRQASFETDPEMGQVGNEPDAVRQQVTCSSCLTDHVVTATDPAQPMPPCPSCGALTLSPGGSTLAARRQAKVAEIVAGIRATNPGMPPQIAHRVAVQTIRRFPSILGN
jgi:hypothetical protein